MLAHSGLAAVQLGPAGLSATCAERRAQLEARGFAGCACRVLPGLFCCSVLSLWVKGSGLTSISMSFIDTATNTFGRDLRFTSADSVKGVAKVLGNDDDGFINILITIAALSNLKPNSTAGAAQACKPATPHFDEIRIADISGMGFSIVLDDLKLISGKQFAASASSLFPVSTVVPVLGDDLPALKSGNNRYLAKLRDTARYQDVQGMCQELDGTASTPRRFAGVCNTPLAKVTVVRLLQPKLGTASCRTAMAHSLRMPE